MNDLISRQAVIEAIHEDADWLAAQGSDWQVERMERDKSILKSLPSAQPEPEPVGCYGCRYERFGNRVCDVCSRLYADRYSAERRTDGTEDTD